MYATNDLRFVEKDGKKILQQKFTLPGPHLPDPSLNHPEWRDVPCEDKTQQKEWVKICSWVSDCKCHEGIKEHEREKVCDEIVEFIKEKIRNRT